ncbi:MAG: branched-chain amino acid ABC transporter permease, partial [Clostridiales bacterium]|nr:branched-chain amino acid ABC transporter permease [Clostridiales bacterium]
MNFLSYLIKGISLGSVYSIIALGYTMVYGIAKMLNFAHGDVIMIGGYIMYIAMSAMGFNPLIAVLIAMVFCTLLGVTIERIAYKPLRSASSLAVLITAIGVSYLLQNLALLIFGADTKSFKSVITLPALKLAGGDLSISGETLITIPLCIIIMIGLQLYVKKSKTGRGMIAVSEDKEAAILMGVNVNKT